MVCSYEGNESAEMRRDRGINMRKMLFLFIILALLFSGCSIDKGQVQDKKEVTIPAPNVRAFQDSFTRGFLTSTKEVLPGYYPFRSKTGGYEMAFPAGGVVGEKSYEFRKKDPGKSFELLMAAEHVGSYDPIKEVSASLTIDYFSYYDKATIEANLDRAQKDLGRKGILRKLALKDRDVYWSTYTENEYEYYGAAGYVQNTANSGGIYFLYDFHCKFGLKKCQQLAEVFNQETALPWVKLIQFNEEL